MTDPSKPVFVSYARSTSADAARALVRELGEESCFLDERDLDELCEFPRELTGALLAARVVVVLVDERYFRRWYCVREWMLAVAPWRQTLRGAEVPDDELALGHLVVALPETPLELRDQERLPPRVQRENLPLAGETQVLADAVRRRLESSELTLAQRFQQIGVPDTERDVLADTRMQRPALAMRETPGNSPDIPLSLHDGFVGRANEIWDLHHVLSTLRVGGAAAALTGALHGGGGYGKTQLAAEYARRLGPAAYRGGVFWVNAGDPTARSTSIREALAAALPPEQRQQVQTLPEKQVPGRLREALLARAGEGDVLYVIDNLPEPEAGCAPLDPADLCPAFSEVTCLVTSRTRQGIGAGIATIDVDVLDDGAALELLLHGVGGESTLAPGEWTEILTWTGNLPLVLNLLNGMLARGTGPRQLLERAREGEVGSAYDRYVDSLRGEVAERYLRNLTQVFGYSYEQLDEASRQALHQLAWASPEPIPTQLLEAVCTAEDRDRVRSQLVGRSFLTPVEDLPMNSAFRLHRVLASFVRGLVRSPETRASLLEATTSCFVTSSGDDDLPSPVAIALVPHITAQLRYDSVDGREGRRDAWWRLARKLNPVAERCPTSAPVELAVQVARHLLAGSSRDANEEDWAHSQANLGYALDGLGQREGDPARLAEAVDAYRAALQVYTREQLPLDWAMTQNNLGIALRGLGEREGDPARLAEAVDAYRAALQVYTREQLPLQWAATQNNLGNALASLGQRDGDPARLAAAVDAYRAAL
ncbi:MAG: tetratricopeptide repeat protein, partial [Planctomycetota bacterium]